MVYFTKRQVTQLNIFLIFFLAGLEIMHDILFSQLCANHNANTVNVWDKTSASVILDMPEKPEVTVENQSDPNK